MKRSLAWMVALFLSATALAAQKLPPMPVMVLYTKAVVSQFGSVEGARAQTLAQVQACNASYANSGIPGEYVLVYFGPAAPKYDALDKPGMSYKQVDDVNALFAMDRSAAKLRFTKGAALYSLSMSWVPKSTASGRPHRVQDLGPWAASSVINAGSLLAPCHEWGHAYGSGHDDQHQLAVPGDQFSYARGVVYADGTCDLMAYCDDPQQVISGVRKTWKGRLYGDARHDNVRVIMTNWTRVRANVAKAYLPPK